MTRKPKFNPEEIEMNPAENHSRRSPSRSRARQSSNVTPIAKPSGFSLDKFKSKRPASCGRRQNPAGGFAALPSRRCEGFCPAAPG